MTAVFIRNNQSGLLPFVSMHHIHEEYVLKKGLNIIIYDPCTGPYSLKQFSKMALCVTVQKYYMIYSTLRPVLTLKAV